MHCKRFMFVHSGNSWHVVFSSSSYGRNSGPEQAALPFLPVLIVFCSTRFTEQIHNAWRNKEAKQLSMFIYAYFLTLKESVLGHTTSMKPLLKDNKHRMPVFPTHRLYLGGPRRYIWWHICFYYYHLLRVFFFFFHLRFNETICDRLTVGQSPLARTARSVCSRNVNTPTDNLQCFPYVHLFVAACNNIHPPLPSAPASLTHECSFSTIFVNFQNILAAFFP